MRPGAFSRRPARRRRPALPLRLRAARRARARVAGERRALNDQVSPRVLLGSVAPLGPRGHRSGIDKKPVPGPWRIGATGIDGDAQADLKHHGGPEKAVHHYPFEHYDVWCAEIGDAPALAAPGGFGENLSTLGWTEETVCVGDIVAFGSARLEVSQGRQPCFKLNLRFGRRDMARRVQDSGRTGWYYRVTTPGVAREGDALMLLERPFPDWPLTRLSRLLYRDTRDRAGLAAMAALAPLAEGWRALAARRLDTGKVENWSARLYGRLPRG
jgi:MOSC domain-containing protein YiiM